MITDSEDTILEALGSHQIDDVAVLVTTIMLSRYDRIRKEAAQLNMILGPKDFLALALEAHDDVCDWWEKV